MTTPPLSPKQLASVVESSGTVNIWEGSVRSGKTIASLLRWLIYVSTSTVRGELLIVSRTRDSAARNVFAPLTDPNLFGEAAKHITYTAGAPTATILGRTVWVLGSSDVRSENVLRGLTCGGAYVDEVTLLQEDFWQRLLDRRWMGAQIFGTTNPGPPTHWLKAKFLDRLHELPDWRSWKFRLDDNPELTEERKAAMRREKTGLYYRRDILGEWVAAEGAVYDMWDPDRHVVPTADMPRMDRLLGVGVDYGTTNATAGLLLGVATTDRPRLYLLDEWRYEPSTARYRLTDAQLSAGLREWIDGQQQRVEWVFIDPAAASLKVQMHADGIRGVTNADNDVSYGIRTMASLLASGDLLVSAGCRGFLAEVSGYSWDPKATEKGEDRPLKTADHSLDAARYVIATTESVWRPMLARAA